VNRGSFLPAKALPAALTGFCVIALAMIVAWRADASSPPPAPVRSCDTRTEGGAPPTRFVRPSDVVAGPIVFTGLARVAARSAFRRLRTHGVYVVKAAARVRANRVVTLVVPAAYRDRASLSYAGSRLRSVSDGVSAVRFEACPSSEPAFSYRGIVGPWTGFNGGFLVSRPICLPIEVWVEGRRARTRKLVSFGKGRCARRGARVMARASPRGVRKLGHVAFRRAARIGVVRARRSRRLVFFAKFHRTGSFRSGSQLLEPASKRRRCITSASCR
jgi:hypothetical protein